MKLLIVRHADAGDRDEFARTGRPDSERPLSARGVAQMRAASRALMRLVPLVDTIATSPYARAMETAEILRKAYRAGPLVQTESLEPDAAPKVFTKWLRSSKDEIVMCVGHEPNLGMLVSWLTAGTDESYVVLKKGGACLINLGEAAGRGAGELRWLLGPRELELLD